MTAEQGAGAGPPATPGSSTGGASKRGDQAAAAAAAAGTAAGTAGTARGGVKRDEAGATSTARDERTASSPAPPSEPAAVVRLALARQAADGRFIDARSLARLQRPAGMRFCQGSATIIRDSHPSWSDGGSELTSDESRQPPSPWASSPCRLSPPPSPRTAPFSPEASPSLLLYPSRTSNAHSGNS